MLEQNIWCDLWWFLANVEGKYEGFFRIPQVLPFVTYAHRKFTDARLSEISEVCSEGGKLMDLLPIYKRMGSLLVSKHKVEQAAAKAGCISISTLSPEAAAALVRFISVSSHADVLFNYQDHEKDYNELIKNDPAKYSPFRESNPNHQRMLLALRQEKPRYLPRLMIWRVYGWDLDVEVQEQLRFDRIESGTEFYHNWEKVRKCKSLKVTYDGQYCVNVPSTIDGMEDIWNGGERLWAEWSNRIPVNFIDAQMSIVSRFPSYGRGNFSVLLLGDLVRAGVVVSPTEVEMAKLVVDTNADAYHGLKLLGCERDVAVALQEIRKVLNSQLPESVKVKFFDGEVGLFDVEHILCQVHRKQGQANTSTIWRIGIRKEGGSKRRIKSQEIDSYGLGKRAKVK